MQDENRKQWIKGKEPIFIEKRSGYPYFLHCNERLLVVKITHCIIKKLEWLQTLMDYSFVFESRKYLNPFISDDLLILFLSVYGSIYSSSLNDIALANLLLSDPYLLEALKLWKNWWRSSLWKKRMLFTISIKMMIKI